MKPPTKRKEPRAGGSRRESGRHTSRDDSTSRHFVVVIRGGSKRGTWGTFATIEQAAAVAFQLRRHGLLATVTDEREVAS